MSRYFFYLLIFLNAETLANLSGVSGYETVIRVYSLVLPLMSYSSIQYAVYRKNFHYKKLGIIRVIAKLIPVLVTIPLALYTQSYWSLVIGNLVGGVSDYRYSNNMVHATHKTSL